MFLGSKTQMQVSKQLSEAGVCSKAGGGEIEHLGGEFPESGREVAFIL